MLSRVAEAMPVESPLQVQGLQFHAGKGELQLQLQGEASAFEALQQRLRAQPLRLEATRRDDGGMQLKVGEAQ